MNRPADSNRQTVHIEMLSFSNNILCISAILIHKCLALLIINYPSIQENINIIWGFPLKLPSRAQKPPPPPPYFNKGK